VVVAPGHKGEEHARADQIVDTEQQDGADADNDRGDDVGATHVDDQAVKAAYDRFMARLRAFRVLDPACGSGNFLYLGSSQSIKI
jgi:hypothetical protein